MAIIDHSPPSIDSILLTRFAAIVGEKYAITDPQAQLPYLGQMRDLYRGRTPIVLRPGSVLEVAQMFRLANETATPIVPQGGNTGLVGGQIPFHNEILLSLTRLNRIREVDPTSNTITCEAGVTLQRAREAATAVDRLSLSATAALRRYLHDRRQPFHECRGHPGTRLWFARSHVLGIEVVLADGRILDNLNKLKKDNTGYDLKNLFIGAEGALGVITAAVLRVVPRPRSVETAFLGVSSPQEAVAVLEIACETAAGAVTSFELMTRFGVELVLRHASGCRDPLPSPHAWYVLIELSSQQREGLRDTLEDMLERATERGLVVDAVIAESLEHSKAFWRIREMFGEVQRHAGGWIRHDVSVPVAAVPAFISEANAAVTALIPGARPLPFGHLGDGNIHYNVTPPAGVANIDFFERSDKVNAAVFAVVKKYRGSVSAEHGIGVLKRDLLAAVKDQVALDLMRSIKRMLDPKNILNPGKVL